MASSEQDKVSPSQAMNVDRKRGSGLPRMLTGSLSLNSSPQTIEGEIAAKASLPLRHFKSQAARDASLLQLAKTTNKGGSRGSQASVPNRLPNGLTLKQEQFCQNVMAGMSHAEAYRDAYDCRHLKPAVVYQRAYTVVINPRVKARLDQLWVLREGRLSHTPAQMRLFIQERLHLEAVSPDNPPSVRVRALELMGKIGRVSLFTPETEKPEDNQSIEGLLKRIAPLLEAGKVIAAQNNAAETPSKSRRSV